MYYKYMSNNKIIIKSSQLGIKDYIRNRNLNHHLVKAYNKGIKILIIDNSPNKDTKYNVVKEIQKLQKRNLIMIIDETKLGWRKEVQIKNLNKYLLKAYIKEIEILIIDKYPDYNDKYNVVKEVLKRKLI